MKKIARRSKYADMSPVERSIHSREKGIERMKANISQIQQRATEQVAEITVRMKEKQFLVDALRRGNIKNI